MFHYIKALVGSTSRDTVTNIRLYHEHTRVFAFDVKIPLDAESLLSIFIKPLQDEMRHILIETYTNGEEEMFTYDGATKRFISGKHRSEKEQGIDPTPAIGSIFMLSSQRKDDITELVKHPVEAYPPFNRSFNKTGQIPADRYWPSLADYVKKHINREEEHLSEFYVKVMGVWYHCQYINGEWDTHEFEGTPSGELTKVIEESPDYTPLPRHHAFGGWEVWALLADIDNRDIGMTSQKLLFNMANNGIETIIESNVGHQDSFYYHPPLNQDCTRIASNMLYDYGLKVAYHMSELTYTPGYILNNDVEITVKVDIKGPLGVYPFAVTFHWRDRRWAIKGDNADKLADGETKGVHAQTWPPLGSVEEDGSTLLGDIKLSAFDAVFKEAKAIQPVHDEVNRVVKIIEEHIDDNGGKHLRFSVSENGFSHYLVEAHDDEREWFLHLRSTKLGCQVYYRSPTGETDDFGFAHNTKLNSKLPDLIVRGFLKRFNE